MFLTVAETNEYSQKAGSLLNTQEREVVIDYLSMHPTAGVLIKGTGGIRKLRWGRNNRGKSSGVRIIYYYYNETLPLYLLTLFGKGEKVDLSACECRALARLVVQIRDKL